MHDDLAKHSAQVGCKKHALINVSATFHDDRFAHNVSPMISAMPYGMRWPHSCGVKGNADEESLNLTGHEEGEL